MLFVIILLFFKIHCNGNWKVVQDWSTLSWSTISPIPGIHPGGLKQITFLQHSSEIINHRYLISGKGYSDNEYSIDSYENLWKFSYDLMEWFMTDDEYSNYWCYGGSQGSYDSSNHWCEKVGAGGWVYKDDYDHEILCVFGGMDDDGSGGDYWNELFCRNFTINFWAQYSSSTYSGRRENGVWPTIGTCDQPHMSHISSRWNMVTFIDESDNDMLYVYGGYGFSSSVTGFLGDFWGFDMVTYQWCYLGGKSDGDQDPIYDTKGAYNSANDPGGRESSTSWEYGGEFCIFGGKSKNQIHNDVFCFQKASQYWGWILGSSSTDSSYGGSYSNNNIPGARFSMKSVFLQSRYLVMGFGSGYDMMNDVEGRLGDLWVLDWVDKQWKFIDGFLIRDVSDDMRGTATTTEDDENYPGCIDEGFFFQVLNNKLLVMGGLIAIGNGKTKYSNSLWEYQLPADYSDPVSLPTCNGIAADDSNVCSNRGTCISTDTCECFNPWFEGQWCQYPVCYTIPDSEALVCSGHGNCTFPDENPNGEIWVFDESGLKNSDSSTYGYGERGGQNQRKFYKNLKRDTICPVISEKGEVVFSYYIEHTSGDVFILQNNGTKVLIPPVKGMNGTILYDFGSKLIDIKNSDVRWKDKKILLVCDNLGCHKSKVFVKLMKINKFDVYYTPPLQAKYVSPCDNYFFSYVKDLFRNFIDENPSFSPEEKKEAVENILTKVPSSVILGSFLSSGFPGILTERIVLDESIPLKDQLENDKFTQIEKYKKSVNYKEEKGKLFSNIGKEKKKYLENLDSVKEEKLAEMVKFQNETLFEKRNPSNYEEIIGNEMYNTQVHDYILVEATKQFGDRVGVCLLSNSFLHFVELVVRIWKMSENEIETENEGKPNRMERWKKIYQRDMYIIPILLVLPFYNHFCGIILSKVGQLIRCILFDSYWPIGRIIDKKLKSSVVLRNGGFSSYTIINKLKQLDGFSCGHHLCFFVKSLFALKNLGFSIDDLNSFNNQNNYKYIVDNFTKEIINTLQNKSQDRIDKSKGIWKELVKFISNIGKKETKVDEEGDMLMVDGKTKMEDDVLMSESSKKEDESKKMEIDTKSIEVKSQVNEKIAGFEKKMIDKMEVDTDNEVSRHEMGVNDQKKMEDDSNILKTEKKDDKMDISDEIIDSKPNNNKNKVGENENDSKTERNNSDKMDVSIEKIRNPEYFFILDTDISTDIPIGVGTLEGNENDYLTTENMFFSNMVCFRSQISDDYQYLDYFGNDNVRDWDKDEILKIDKLEILEKFQNLFIKNELNHVYNQIKGIFVSSSVESKLSSFNSNVNEIYNGNGIYFSSYVEKYKSSKDISNKVKLLTELHNRNSSEQLVTLGLIRQKKRKSVYSPNKLNDSLKIESPFIEAEKTPSDSKNLVNFGEFIHEKKGTKERKKEGLIELEEFLTIQKRSEAILGLTFNGLKENIRYIRDNNICSKMPIRGKKAALQLRLINFYNNRRLFTPDKDDEASEEEIEEEIEEEVEVEKKVVKPKKKVKKKKKKKKKGKKKRKKSSKRKRSIDDVDEFENNTKRTKKELSLTEKNRIKKGKTKFREWERIEKLNIYKEGSRSTSFKGNYADENSDNYDEDQPQDEDEEIFVETVLSSLEDKDYVDEGNDDDDEEEEFNFNFQTFNSD